MNAETAQLLARALRNRWAAESMLIAVVGMSHERVLEDSLRIAAEQFVHEDRIVNRIVAEEAD